MKGGLRILLLEDEEAIVYFSGKELLNSFPEAEIEHCDRAELAFVAIPMFKPDVIILRYQFPTSTAKIIFEKIKKFKGLVILHSDMDRKFLEEECKDLPRIVIIDRSDEKKLVEIIKKSFKK
jgi:DNA-binding NarL/FixJ family response regulator